jgi:hypothetical protein
MKDTPPTVVDLFVARRIAEFPGKTGATVMYEHVICGMGDCYWDDNGLLQHSNQHYDPKTKKFTQYPLRMPMETALEMTHIFGHLFTPYYNMNGPINRMPVNIHDEWLLWISIFLDHWGAYTMDDFKLMATVYCLKHYHFQENKNAGLPQRTIDDYQQFFNLIPKWKAMVANIRYQKQYNKIDPATYKMIDI